MHQNQNPGLAQHRPPHLHRSTGEPLSPARGRVIRARPKRRSIDKPPGDWLACCLVTVALWTFSISPTQAVPRNTPESGAKWAPLRISDSPTTQDICLTAFFERPLRPTRQPTDPENQELLQALQRFAQRTLRDDFSGLAAFVEAQPDNPWAVSVETQLGREFCRTGRYSRALAALEHAWGAKRLSADAESTVSANLAGSELAQLYSHLGYADRLRALLDELHQRPKHGQLAALIRDAEQSLWAMDQQPEHAFRCGPMALHRLFVTTERKENGDSLIARSRATTNGCSAQQVVELAGKLGMKYQVAFRSPGAPILLPAIVHWKVGHFSAMIGRDGNLIRVDDPTFGNKTWVSDQALAEEASGYFLVRSGPLPRGWRTVSQSEGAQVWGKGPTGSNSKECDPNKDPSCKPKPCPGMADWNITLAQVNQHIEDTPLAYTPPVGPAINFTVSFDSLDAEFQEDVPYSNVAPDWRINWLAWITDDPMNPAGDVTFAIDGGGNVTFSDYNPTNQLFSNLFHNRADLVRTGTNSYELRYPDGSKKIFDSPGYQIGTARQIFMTAVVDPAGNAATVQFESPGKITSITDAIGQQTKLYYEFAYTAFWLVPDPPYSIPFPGTNYYLLPRVVDPFGRTATFQVDSPTNFYPVPNEPIVSAAWAHLTNSTDAMGMASGYGYSGNWLQTLTTPYGQTRFDLGTYNGIWRADWIEVTEPNGEKERVEYSENPRVQVPNEEPLAIVPKGVPVRNLYMYARNTYFWDRKAYAEGFATDDYTKARICHWTHAQDYNTASPILESFKEPLEHRVWFTYDGQMNPTFAGTSDRPTTASRVLEDGTTQLYQFTYNPLGNITRTVDPVGREFTFVYETNNIDLLEVRQTRAGQNEVIFSATYNEQHRRLAIAGPDRQTNHFAYNAHGQLLSATNARGDVTAFSYDRNGYLLTIDGPLPGTNDTWRFTYDAVGRLLTTTDPDGYALTYNYDDLNRLTTITYPDATSEQITYDRLDPVVLRDRAGRITYLTFDSLRQLTAVQDPLGRITRYQWCGCGGLETAADPMGRATSWVRDLQGRVRTKVYADGSQVNFEYDSAAGWLRSRRDERNQVTSFDYDSDGTIRQERFFNASFATAPVQFSYDANYPRLAQMQDGEGTTVFTYYPVTSSPKLGAGRLYSIQGPWPNAAITYQYDELSRVASRAINGVAERRTYDPASRLSELTNALGSFIYTWDGSSRRLSSVSYPNGQYSRFSYLPNSQDRLLQSITHYLPDASVLSQFTQAYNATSQVTNWTQIQGGALRSWVPTYDAGDRLLRVIENVSNGDVHAYTYAYDASDNLVLEQTDLARQEFSYNALNQLITGGNGLASNVSYCWDAANRLVGITNGLHFTGIAYDGLGRRTHVVEEENGSVTSDRRYVWCGPQLCEERDSSGSRVLKRFFYNGLRAEVGGELPPGTYFSTRDHLQSIREMTDSAGAVRAQSAYSPFGVRQSLGGDLRADFGFTGHYEHQSSGLDLALYRPYSPGLGRWLNRDPLGELGGMNIYAYSRNNPINLIDPTGLDGVGWGVGISAEASFVQPLTSGGGGAVGANLQYLSEGEDKGLGLYTYTPGTDPSFGVNIGVGLQLNITWGNGGWTGLFDNLALGVGKFAGSYFQSPCADKTGQGWQGLSLGGGLGPLPATAATYQTDYQKAPSIDRMLEWIGTALGAGQHWAP